MTQVESAKHKPSGSGFDIFINKLRKSAGIKFIVGIAVIVLLVLLISMLSKNDTSRTESYKKATGAAGLSASIEYDCRTSCNQKYNFNVYIFDKNGQQVSVVRPDQRGKVNMAMQEGDYVLLIGKQLAKDKLFPQEKVSLKNGKSLELKLKYKEQ